MKARKYKAIVMNRLSLLISRYFAGNIQLIIISLVNVFLVVALICIIAYQIYELIRIKHLVLYPIYTEKSIVTLPLQNMSIAEWHLFGKEIDVKNSNSKWTLHGIVYNSTGENLAVIASSNTDEAIYHAGDKLSDGSVIVTIFTDHVLLSSGGRTELLYIPWKLENAPVADKVTEVGVPFTLMREP